MTLLPSRLSAILLVAGTVLAAPFLPYMSHQLQADACAQDKPAPNIAELKQQAKAGDAKAQFTLGFLYTYGMGVKKNDAEAVKLYQKAADQGYAAAQYFMGTMYDSGQGVRQDYTEAEKWYQKAAAQGSVVAQFALGVAYARGQGVQQNIETAKEWFGKACSNHDQHACDLQAKLTTTGHL